MLRGLRGGNLRSARAALITHGYGLPDTIHEYYYYRRVSIRHLAAVSKNLLCCPFHWILFATEMTAAKDSIAEFAPVILANYAYCFQVAPHS